MIELIQPKRLSITSIIGTPLIKVVGVQRVRPTMRAADKWDSARFSAFFLASSFSRFQAEPPPTHLRLTPAVGRRYNHSIKLIIENKS